MNIRLQSTSYSVRLCRTFSIWNSFFTRFYQNSGAAFDIKASVYVQRICKVNFRRSLPSSLKNPGCRVSCSQVKLEDSIDDETCELVNGVELSIGEGSDGINAYLFKAVKNNNGTGILLLSDVFGFEDSCTKDFAYRVACNGYKYVVHLH